jgi:AcrR family transcriptional regulator
MVGRPVDFQRRAQLLDGAVDYAIEHGFAELSWRPVAAALGVSTTTLVHHFGTKEQMLEAIQGRLRERMFAATRELAGDRPDLATAARAVWTQSSAPRLGAEFRLFFAVYGRALQDRKRSQGSSSMSSLTGWARSATRKDPTPTRRRPRVPRRS